MTTMSRRRILQHLGTAAFAWPMLSRVGSANRSARTPIKIGQIGAGHAHATKLSVYRQSPDFDVVGIVEPAEKLQDRLRTHDAFRGLPVMSQEQLLNTPGLQAALVETEVSGSLDVAEACIDAGLHVHLDKPAGESLPQYRRILDHAARKNLLVQMGYMYRYNPAIEMLREFLERGWLGDVFEIHTVMSKVVNQASRRELAQYQGGIMFELGCHIIDLVVGVLGKPDRITPYTRSVARADDDLVDNMLAVFEYPQAVATVKSTAVEVEGFARRHFVVCGTEGTFHIQPLDNPSARVALSKNRGEFEKGYQDVQFPKYIRYVADAVDMAAIIRGEKDASFSYEHDLNVQTSVLQASQLPLDQ